MGRGHDGPSPASAASLAQARPRIRPCQWELADEYGVSGPLIDRSREATINGMRTWIDPPEGWGRRQLLISRLEKMGYRVEVHIVVGEALLVLRASGRSNASSRSASGKSFSSSLTVRTSAT